MGRKSKYNPEISKIICDAIAQNGGHESGWIAGQINHDTFYEWLKKYPDFADAVERSQREFQKNCPEEIKQTALQKLQDALENGHKVTWKTKGIKRIDRFDSDGNLRWFQLETTETEHIESRPTPQWAIERVIPKPIWSVEQLSAIASEYGLQLVVKDAELFKKYLSAIEPENEDNRDSSFGLSEEAANEIRRQILGLEE